MKRNEPVTKIMSRHLVTVHHGDSLSKARQLMQERGVHHVPVVSGDQLVGMISYNDILRVSFGDAFNTDPRAEAAVLDHTMTLEKVMTSDVSKLTEHSTIREAAELLAQGKFHSLPVVSGSKLVGMVTSTDLIRYLLEQF